MTAGPGGVGDVPGTLGAVTARPSDDPSAYPVQPERATPPAEPFALPTDAVVAALATDPRTGLSASEAASRLAANGPNELEAAEPVSLPRLIVGAVTEPFVLLLLVAGVGAVALGEVRDGLLVLIGLLPIVGADVVTEYRGERALEALREAAAPDRAGAARRVGRGRARRRSSSRATSSCSGPATSSRPTCDLPRPTGLAIDRSVLTGESVPERGVGRRRIRPDAALAERRSMAYAGTSVGRGRGEGVVVATGPATEVGRIAGGARRARSDGARRSSASSTGSSGSCSSSRSGSSS